MLVLPPPIAAWLFAHPAWILPAYLGAGLLIAPIVARLWWRATGSHLGFHPTMGVTFVVMVLILIVVGLN